MTQYAPGFLPGIEGYTIGQYGLWSRGSDRFIGVCFPGVGTLDVLWGSLEIIDREYLEEAEFRNKKHLEELKTARNVVKYIGPRGGFRNLSYEYVSREGVTNHVSNGFKDDAEKLIKMFEEYGIKIETKTER